MKNSVALALALAVLVGSTFIFDNPAEARPSGYSYHRYHADNQMPMQFDQAPGQRRLQEPGMLNRSVQQPNQRDTGYNYSGERRGPRYGSQNFRGCDGYRQGRHDYHQPQTRGYHRGNGYYHSPRHGTRHNW